MRLLYKEEMSMLVQELQEAHARYPASAAKDEDLSEEKGHDGDHPRGVSVATTHRIDTSRGAAKKAASRGVVETTPHQGFAEKSAPGAEEQHLPVRKIRDSEESVSKGAKVHENASTKVQRGEAVKTVRPEKRTHKDRHGVGVRTTQRSGVESPLQETVRQVQHKSTAVAVARREGHDRRVEGRIGDGEGGRLDPPRLSPKEDSGPPKEDSGPPKEDSGPPKEDSGLPKEDSGLLSENSVSQERHTDHVDIPPTWRKEMQELFAEFVNDAIEQQRKKDEYTQVVSLLARALLPVYPALSRYQEDCSGADRRVNERLAASVDSLPVVETLPGGRSGRQFFDASKDTNPGRSGDTSRRWSCRQRCEAFRRESDAPDMSDRLTMTHSV